MPSGKLIYSRNRWGFTLAASNEVLYLSFQDAWRRNPYLAETSRRLTEQVKYKIDFAAEFRLNNEWMTKIQWQSKQTENVAVFKPALYSETALPSGLFEFTYLNQLNQHTLSLATDFKLATRVAFNANTSYSLFGIVDDSVAGDKKTVPYLPGLTADVSMTTIFWKNASITLAAKYAGERRKNLVTDEMLGDYVLLNLQFEKRFHEFLMLFLHLDNLLNEQFSAWEGYKEPGIQFMGGIKGKW